MRTDRPLRSRPAKFAGTCSRTDCPHPPIAAGEEIAYHRDQLMHGVCANALHATLPEYAAWMEHRAAFVARHRAIVARHRALLAVA